MNIKLIQILLLALVSPAVLAEGQTVHVLLQEWRIVTDVSRVKAGEVTISVQNRGRETHELVLLKSDMPHDQLPLQIRGGINEDIAGTVVDEIEDIGPGTQRKMTVMVEPGNYIILCNMVEMEEGQREEHYAMGMRTPLKVE